MIKRNLNETEAQDLIARYAPKFVESVVLLDDYWFLTTSFSCFIHFNQEIDDCADKSKVGYQSQPLSFLRRKTSMGRDYFELTHRFGDIELLATGGYFGSKNDASFTPFLGSAIQELPDDITSKFSPVFSRSIFINTQQQRYSQMKRVLNQYYKKHANNMWGFQSEAFHNKDFYPAHPPDYDSKNVVHTASSFVINSFATKVYDGRKSLEILKTMNKLDKTQITETGKVVLKYFTTLKKHGICHRSFLTEKDLKFYDVTIENITKSGSTRIQVEPHKDGLKWECYSIKKDKA